MPSGRSSSIGRSTETHRICISFTTRDREISYDVADYWVHKGKPKGLTRTESDLEFDELCQPHETEGQGAERKVWLGTLRGRFRDRTQYIDQAAEQGSRAVRAPEADVRQALRDDALASAGPHRDAFFQQAAQQPPVT